MIDCLSVVIPAFNEALTLARVVGEVQSIPSLLEIVIVDDCSSDGTAAIADDLARRDPRIKVVHHLKNRGKTEALKTGFALTAGDIVIVQDADLEYAPEEIAGVIAPIIAGDADVVFRFSAFWSCKATRVLYFYHYLANKSLTFFFQPAHERQHDRRRNGIQGLSRRNYQKYDDFQFRIRF